MDSKFKIGDKVIYDFPTYKNIIFKISKIFIEKCAQETLVYYNCSLTTDNSINLYLKESELISATEIQEILYT